VRLLELNKETGNETALEFGNETALEFAARNLSRAKRSIPMIPVTPSGYADAAGTGCSAKDKIRAIHKMVRKLIA
jgi:hypothetical protein